ncbi:hypothetical protein [Streptomyces aureoversilis]|uniref:Uncharacterized protein n=1 Tax=Streptomyces aureoversilis TaxID=67277 RepID=A0ABW0A8I6_9ACTN
MDLLGAGECNGAVGKCAAAGGPGWTVWSEGSVLYRQWEEILLARTARNDTFIAWRDIARTALANALSPSPLTLLGTDLLTRWAAAGQWLRVWQLLSFLVRGDVMVALG